MEEAVPRSLENLTRPQASTIPIRWRIFTFMFLFGCVAYVQQKTITVAAASMMPDLKFTQEQIGWLEQAFVLGYAVFQVPGGLLGQRFGARRTFVFIGLTAFLATIATPLAPEIFGGRPLFLVLLGIQCLLGCSQGAIFPLSSGVFEAWFTPGRWSFVQGLQTMGLGLGAALTPPLISSMMSTLGWRPALIWASLPALLLIAAWGWYGRNTPREHPSISTAEISEIEGGEGVAAKLANAPVARGVTGLLKLLCDRNVLLLAFAYLCMNYTFYLLSNWVFLYLVQERGFSLLESGWLATAPPIASAVGAGVGGLLTSAACRRVGDQWGYRLVPLFALPVSALLLLFAVGATNPYVAVAALAACFGCVEMTEGAFWGSGMAVGRGNTMAVCGFMNSAGNLGGIIGIPLVAHFSGQHQWHTAFLIGVACALVSALAWLGVSAGSNNPPVGTVER